MYLYFVLVFFLPIHREQLRTHRELFFFTRTAPPPRRTARDDRPPDAHPEPDTRGEAPALLNHRNTEKKRSTCIYYTQKLYVELVEI